jgi:hypothetical protein
VRALHLVAVLEVAAGVALLGARGAGDVPSFLLVCGAATAVLTVLLRRFARPVPPPGSGREGGSAVPEPGPPPDRPRPPRALELV